MPPAAVAIVRDHPASGVARITLRRSWGGSGHSANCFWFEQRRNTGRSGNVIEKLHKLGRRSDPSRTRIHAVNIELVGIFGILTDVDDFTGSALPLTIIERSAWW